MLTFVIVLCQGVLLGAVSTPLEQWQELKSPQAPVERYAHTANWDPVKQRLLLVGGWKKGYQGGGVLGDTWAFDPKTDQWEKLKSTLRPRHAHTATWDPVKNRLMVVGGLGQGGMLKDAWAFDPKTDEWQELKSTKDLPYWHGHTATWDPVKGRLLVVGGEGGSGTWALDPNTGEWREINSSKSPSARRGHTATWDPVKGRLLVVGGAVGSTSLQDSWAFDPKTDEWQEIKSLKNPPPIYCPEATWDPFNQRLIVMGFNHELLGKTKKLSHETWALDPKTDQWEEIKSAKMPPVRSGYQLVWDLVNKRLILAQGSGPRGSCKDSWSFDPKTDQWDELKSAVSPPARSHYTATWDPVKSRIIMFGGWGTTTSVKDTWALNPIGIIPTPTEGIAPEKPAP